MTRSGAFKKPDWSGAGFRANRDRPALFGMGAFSFLLVALLSLPAPPLLLAEEVVAGPVPAEVMEVTDGDTLKVRAAIWLSQNLEIMVRLEGVDAPEKNGACAKERALALRAKAFVESRIGSGGVILHNIHYGKYARRVLARVTTASGEDLSRLLIESGLGRSYAGEARRSWCS